MATQTNIVPTITADQLLARGAERMVQINLSFSMPQQTKKDAKAQHDAEHANHAHGALNVSRRLWSKAAMAPFLSIKSAGHAYIDSRTIQLMGVKALPTTRLLEVTDELSRRKTGEWQPNIVLFGQNYTNVLREAQTQQGALFDASVYPDVTSITQQFRMSWDIYPLPNRLADFMGNLEDTALRDANELMRESVVRSITTAVEQPLTKLIGAVMNLHNKTGRDDSRISDSIMAELEDITALVPELNVAGLPAIDQMARDARALLTSTEMIRDKDTQERLTTAEKSAALLKQWGVNPDHNVRINDTSSRKDKAQAVADNILSQMGAFF
jgi:hypothetical protein